MKRIYKMKTVNDDSHPKMIKLINYCFAKYIINNNNKDNKHKKIKNYFKNIKKIIIKLNDMLESFCIIIILNIIKKTKK